jgi:hypothetical protein
MPQHEQQRRETWQRVQCQEYRQLGTILSLLEALDRGEDITPGDAIPDGREREMCLVAERLMSRRAACRRLLEDTVTDREWRGKEEGHMARAAGAALRGPGKWRLQAATAGQGRLAV